ncbi:hypothetical protein KBD71_01120 [Candidatus Woesebacteria bacterium]|nr:hypothetical protein [Candidatus Woesebacteria bacterium]
MRKRERFIISSILLAFGLLATQFVSSDIRPIAIVLFFIASYLTSAWALNKTLNGLEWLTVVPFPAFYSLSVSLFYFLLPSNIISRVAILLLFGVGMYALYLASNIFSVGKVKTIQLLRAAHAVGSLFLFLLCLFFFNFVLSLGLSPLLNGLSIGAFVFLPILCGIWSIELLPSLSSRVIGTTVFLSLALGEIGVALSLLPIGLWASSLYLTAILYVGYGIIQNYFIGRLFAKTLQEYIWLVLFVSTSLLVLLEWK